MLEAIIAIVSLVIGLIIGWMIHSKSSPVGNPEKVSQLETELRSAWESETISRTNLTNMQQKFAEEKQRLEEIRKEMEKCLRGHGGSHRQCELRNVPQTGQ